MLRSQINEANLHLIRMVFRNRYIEEVENSPLVSPELIILGLQVDIIQQRRQVSEFSYFA